MEELKKENILKRFLNYIKAGWDRLGQPDIEDEEVELPDYLKGPVQAESMFESHHESKDSKWRVNELENVTPIDSKSKSKNKQPKEHSDDFIIE